MKVKVYSLFDVKAAVYGTPFFTLNDSTAVRSVSMWVADKTTMVANHPEDFSLYEVGEFDDSLGVIVGVTPRIVATASSLVKFERWGEPLNGKLIGKDIEEVVS